MIETRKQLLILAAIFIATRILCFLIVAPNWSDIPIYNRYSDSILDGQTPYSDFAVEYPPVALLIFIIPGFLAKIIGSYFVSYRLFMMVFDLGNVWLINKLTNHYEGSKGGVAFKPILLYLALTGLMFQLLYDRFDIAIAFLVLLSVYFATIRKAWFGAYLIIWIAVLTKVFPIILLPLYLIIQSKTRQKKAEVFVKLALASLVFVGLVIVGGLWFGPWWESVISYHGGRGIQVESMYGTIASVAALFGVPYSINHSFGSFNIENSFTQYLVTLSPFITLAAILYGYYLVYQIKTKARGKPGKDKTLVTGIVAALLIFIIANKVLSPQYLFWLFPLVALSIDTSKLNVWLTICWLVVAAFTAILFPYNYPEMVMQKAAGVSLLIIRNLSLLIIAILIARNMLINTVKSE